MQRYDSYKDSGVKWLGEIPSHWYVLALKHILRLKKEVVGKRASQFDLLSLTLKGVIKRDMENPEGKFPASFDTYQVVESNDFIFCNFDNEETPRAVGLSAYKGMITGAYDVLYRNNPKLSDKFLIYYFLYIDDAKRFKPLYKGLRKTVPFDSFMSYKIPVPSLKEQDAMVSYLDSTTLKIDEAIDQQQKMIDLLNERKQIIINNAVTKGLDPNVKMKPSGIDWIGEIPEGWEVIKLKYIVNWNENTLKDNANKNITINYVEISDVDSINGIKNYSEYILKDAPSRARRITKRGDIIVSTVRTYLKAVAQIEQDNLIVSTGFAVLSSKEHIDNKYLALSLKSESFVNKVIRESVGMSYPAINASDLVDIKIALPSLKEQRYIVEKIYSQLEKIDGVVDNYYSLISLLQERKQIIINDVVTGKVKVI